MSARPIPWKRRALPALGLLALTLTAVAVAVESRRAPEKAPAPTPIPGPIFNKLESAANPTTLQLQADESKVVGWVSGRRSFHGEQVFVTVGGEKKTLLVGPDNTFTYPYEVKKETPADFAVRVSWGRPLQGRVTLLPAKNAEGPCVFFVVDRTAYRPGQALKFAGFLRAQGKGGDFEPIAKKEVEVTLTSARKATVAAKMKLTSDEAGRVTGEYAFTDADALDNYTLAIKDVKGTAQVLLGEYRKSKVRLKITGKTAGDKLAVTFEGLDFLDKPVVLTKAQYVAQVVRRGKVKEFALKAEDFVYHDASKRPLNDIDSLSEEDLLLAEAEGVVGQTYAGMGNVPLKNLDGTPKVEGGKPAVAEIALEREWMRGDCAVVVQGVVTDANGREQRATATIPIASGTTKEEDKPLEVNLPRKRFTTGEVIDVVSPGVGGKGATLVVMRLNFQTASATLQPFGSGTGLGLLPGYRYGRYGGRPPVNAVGGTTETLRRTLVTAVPYKGDRASVTLKQPGAYKLIATVPGEDGTAVQQETTVVVKRAEDVHPLAIRMDKEEYASTDRLTGAIHSRFENAVALLTLRDSSGVRMTKRIEFEKGVYRLDEAFPAKMRYGCTIDVSYPDSWDHAYVADAFVRVVPKDRILDVKVTTPDNVPPGSTIDVNLDVNRREEVDLVVSVYDQSLLGIAPDRSTDIRNFFLADERARNAYERHALRRMVGDLTIKEAFARAEKLLKDATGENPKRKLPQAEIDAVKAVVASRNTGYLYAHQVGTLLRVAGMDLFLAPYSHGSSWYVYYNRDGVTENDRLIDAVGKKTNGWQLVPKLVGSTLMLHETHESYVNNYAWHPVYGWSYNYGYGGYGGPVYYGAAGGHENFALHNSWQLQSYRFAQSPGVGRGGFARGDGSMTYASTANSSHSFAEGQAVLSHLPVGGPVGGGLIGADADQGHIMVRRDFSDSAFWNAKVRTDAAGKATVKVKLPDSLTNWQVVVTAVSKSMDVGAAKASFRTFKPVMVWPMLPRTFTEGDAVRVFASVHNRTDEPQLVKVKLKVDNGKILSPETATVKVAPKSNEPVYWTFAPGASGFTQLLMTADAPAGNDASLKRLPVVAAAAEQAVTASGTVKKSMTFDIPPGVDLKDSRLEITYAPSVAADIADTLNYLVEYPYGCVEQTMSRFLPAVKVAQILKQYKIDHPELQKKMPLVAAAGIKRLLELQQGDGGWGWQGQGTTHEMMTPYALYGLLQAEKGGYQIPNETAITRGLDRLNNFIANMGDGQTDDRVYCMYVYNHRRELAAPLWTWLEGRANADKLSDYALGLALEMAVLSKKRDLADGLAKKLAARATKDGDVAYWTTAKFTRWMEDRFEITAQAMRALVAHDRNDPLVEKALAFFMSTKRGDRWNSTKDTAMILYALTDYLAKTEYDPKALKSLAFAVNDGDKKAVEFKDQLTHKAVIKGEALKHGTNTVTFDTEMKGVLYRLAFKYYKRGKTLEPLNQGLKVTRTFYLADEKGVMGKELKSGDTIDRGSYVMSRVEVSHALPEALRYVLVENPRPASGEIVPETDPRFTALQVNASTRYALREDREGFTAFHLEETPANLVVQNVFLAELSGEFVVAPAKSEMMYRTEKRGHSGSFVLKVADKK